jgi:hypothetical protein
MIDQMTKEQRAAMYAAWLSLNAEGKYENPDAFRAGRRWALTQSFDAIVTVVEFFVWNAAVSADAASVWLEDEDFAALDANECDVIREMAYQSAWVQGVADVFVLAGDNVIMSEWLPATKH